MRGVGAVFVNKTIWKLDEGWRWRRGGGERMLCEI